MSTLLKTCTHCGQAKPGEDFEITRTNETTGVSYRHGTCRECRNAMRRESAATWYAANSEYQKAAVVRRRKANNL